MPSEIIDLLNLLTEKVKYQKKDFFDKNGDLIKSKKKELGELFKGKISYLRDMNPDLFATQKFVGTKVRDINYLLFQRCPMSNYQYNTIKKAEKIKKNSQDIIYLYDLVVPSPDNDNIGSISVNEIKTKVENANKNWKIKNGIDIINGKIYGDFLKYENIKKYSSKYYSMLTNLKNNIINKEGKIFIYHKYIHVTGVLLIEEILKKNGIIKYGGFVSMSGSDPWLLFG